MRTTIAQERKILDLAIKINGTEHREADKGKPAVFVRIYPHVAGFEVSAYPKGWKSYDDEEKATIKKDWDFNLADDYQDDAEECIAYLEELLKEAE